MDIYDYVEREEIRLQEKLSSGEIDIKEYGRLLQELYREAREEENNKHIYY
jgi:hypothetical protein